MKSSTSAIWVVKLHHLAQEMGSMFLDFPFSYSEKANITAVSVYGITWNEQVDEPFLSSKTLNMYFLLIKVNYYPSVKCIWGKGTAFSSEWKWSSDRSRCKNLFLPYWGRGNKVIFLLWILFSIIYSQGNFMKQTVLLVPTQSRKYLISVK